MRLNWGTKKALEEAEESSDRSRHVLLVMLVTSVLVAMAAWNSRLTGWAVKRLDVAQEREKAAHASAREKRPLERGVPPPPDVRQAAVDADAQQRLIAERIRFVSVPVLGFGFDLNDLALVGGLAFVLLLMWFHFTMGREWLNVDELFRRARADGSLRDAYDLLSMTQVLTTPPHPNGHLGSGWGGVSRLLFWAPCLVQGSVVLHDFLTARRGETVSRGWTLATQLAGFFCLLLMVKLTRDCWQYSRRIARLWNDAFRAAHVKPQYFATAIERNAEGEITRLTNQTAPWSIPASQAVRQLKDDTAAFFYVEPQSGARLLLQLNRDDGGEELLGTVPGLVERIRLP